MIMLGLYNLGEIPYSTVYLHGTVRNEHGQRMSKSLGTGIDPLEVIEKYGADALRYTLITSSGPGNDMKLSEQRVEMGRNFANKLWNVTRFVISMIGEGKVAPVALDSKLQTANSKKLGALPLEDRWILSRVEGLARSVDEQMRKFELGEAARQVYEFVWSEFADWYIEIAKVRVRGTTAEGTREAVAAGDSPLPVLAYVLERSLRLLHPFMPFVTEELWQALTSKIDGIDDGALIVAAYPRGESGYADAAAEREMEMLIDVVRAIRNIRAEKKVEPAKFIEAYVVADGARGVLEAGALYIEMLSRARPLHIVGDIGQAPKDQVATAVLEGVTAVVPLAGLFDTAAERTRLGKLIADAEAEAGRIDAKLSNEQFRAKAPEKVVAAEEERLTAVRARLDGLRAGLAELG
jgi:valyl-tRNA synthetase